MFRLRKTQHTMNDNLSASHLLDQNSFYKAFMDDLRQAKSQVIIECPFITVRRMSVLLPTFRMLAKRGLQLVINTKPLDEHNPEYSLQAEQATSELQQIGALVLFTDGHHRKLVIIDKRVLYEGSLNVLSQNDSCEIMRRIDSEQLAHQWMHRLEHKGAVCICSVAVFML
jgi:phosphatidylserine/phosphatidylglycerophosphate/cardiolipin synthase-like enzyme